MSHRTKLAVLAVAVLIFIAVLPFLVFGRIFGAESQVDDGVIDEAPAVLSDLDD